MPDVTPDRFARIELLLLDVDGVLTDGRVVYTDAGAEIKAFESSPLVPRVLGA